VQINLNGQSLTQAVDGNKTYIALATGAAIIALNHFGLIPHDYVPAGLDPSNWINDEFKLLLGATGRSALKKLESDAAAKPAPHETKS
jgi:hypothetical protein